MATEEGGEKPVQIAARERGKMRNELEVSTRVKWVPWVQLKIVVDETLKTYSNIRITLPLNIKFVL